MMEYLGQSNTELLGDRALFEEIHRLKSFFIHLFSELANDISLDRLSEAHAASQGVKISKGNELEHCPYQVLDIVRDFDSKAGFNIRVLNWWGRGLFVLVYTGKDNTRLMHHPGFIASMQQRGYMLAKTSSPWDYKRMIDQEQMEVIPSVDALDSHVSRFKYFQILKKIEYPASARGLNMLLKDQVEHILKYYVA